MSQVSGLVVAGGRATRLGTDKRDVRVGGMTLLDRAVQLVAGLSDDVLIAAPAPRPDIVLDAGRARSAAADPALTSSIRFVPDTAPDRGPLAGILAGLRHAREDRLLVVPVDMPLLTPPFLHFLVDVAPEAAVTVPRWRAGLEPLVAVYHRSCAEEVAARLERGSAAVHAFITSTRLPVRYVEESEVRPHGDSARLFLNINTPEDLTRAEQLLADPQPPRARP